MCVSEIGVGGSAGVGGSLSNMRIVLHVYMYVREGRQCKYMRIHVCVWWMHWLGECCVVVSYTTLATGGHFIH